MGQSHYYWWHVVILLRLRAKYHCTTEKPARQPHACQPASFELSFRIHTTHRTPNIKIQPTLGHSFPISISNTHSLISPQLSFINYYSINWSIKHIWINGSYGSGSGMTGTLFLLFLWAIVMDLTSALRMPSRCESILVRRRVFRAFVAYLLNQAVNPTHVPFVS